MTTYENDERYMFTTSPDVKANRSSGSYGNAFQIHCNRCKARVFGADYGNGTGARYVAVWARDAKIEHYNACIQG